MDRRKFLAQGACSTLLLVEPWASWCKAQMLEFEKGVPNPEPVPELHFPDRVHLFVWRNWELANTGRMAQVLGTTSEKVLEIGAAMGLPQKPQLNEDQLGRIYITVIRQNWHILPDDQLMGLLGWDQKHYGYTLREDDALWLKLGLLKPRCERLRYEEPSPKARQGAAKVKRILKETFGPSIDAPGEPAFQFVTDLSSTHAPSMRNTQSRASDGEVDLSRGWTMRKAGGRSEIPAQLLEEFKAHLGSGFGGEVNLPESARAGSKVIQISVDPRIADTTGSFEVSVQPEEIRIVGRDVPGIRQALYYLQEQMEERQGPYLAKGSIRRTTRVDPRYVYSYFALYGDPLMEDRIDPFPNGFLDKLARAGVNGVWLQAVLRNLAPSNLFPEFGAGWETRLRNLNKLVERCEGYGIKVYMYINEPRSMPAEFFLRHPNIKGTYDEYDPGYFALCTSTPEVRQWLSESMEHVFSQVPRFGGIFCITASENLTNCYSHGRAQLCPRCSKRPGEEVIAEVIQTFRDGVRRSSREGQVIAWDWGWGQDWVRNGADTEGIIARLPTDVPVLSVSEWGQPINRGGYPTKVGEYSMSVVGPGPRPTRSWELARQRGLATLAKVQWSNTWEISAVPYIPVPNLIVEHCENLLKADIRGLMLSWTVGGYPSPNFEVAKEYYFSPGMAASEVLRKVAERRYGKAAVPGILEAWKAFSVAFSEFPMEGGALVYHIPTQHGPSNPLRVHRTGYKATVMLFPYDDFKGWVGSYPVEVVEKQFEKMTSLWEPGLKSFRDALALVPAHQQTRAHRDFGIAETCYLHFQSTANQIRFYRLREELDSGTAENRPPIAAQMVKIAEEEIELARRQYAIARPDSTIGYEASNHYYYRPLDLVEKVLNCRDIIETLQKG